MDRIVRACVWSCLVLAACGGDDEKKTSAADWGGEDLHFRAEGKVDGEDISIELGADEVAANLHCILEYTTPDAGNGEPDYANGKLTEIKIEGFVEIDGEERGLEIELKRHDFQSDEAGAEITVVPRDDTEDPAADEAWLEWEWHDAVTDDESYQASANNGVITLEMFGGELNDTGLVKENVRIGVTFDGRWSETEEMKTTMTVDCDDALTVVGVEGVEQ